MFAWVFDRILMLLHPFMPFITEELWDRIGETATRDTLLILAPWPQLEGLEDKAADDEMNWVIDLIAEVRSVRSEMNVPPAAQLPLVITAAGGGHSRTGGPPPRHHCPPRTAERDRLCRRRT